MWKTLDPKENYGQVYIRTVAITGFYDELLDKEIAIHPNGKLNTQPWGSKRVFFNRY